MFDIADHLDELRCWPTGRLEARREELIGVQREARVEELAIVRVLDERGRIDPTLDDHGESVGRRGHGCGVGATGTEYRAQ